MYEYTPKIIAIPTGLEILYTANKHEGECTMCCQQIQLRKKTLSKLSGDILKGIIEQFSGKVTPQNVRESMGSVAYANYTALKYWNLLEPVKIGDQMGWGITATGNDFYNGQIVLPEVLWVFNDVPRLVPVQMYGRWVGIKDLQPEEMSHAIAASESMPLDSTKQYNLI